MIGLGKLENQLLIVTSLSYDRFMDNMDHCDQGIKQTTCFTHTICHDVSRLPYQEYQKQHQTFIDEANWEVDLLEFVYPQHERINQDDWKWLEKLKWTKELEMQNFEMLRVLFSVHDSDHSMRYEQIFRKP